jgi:hypothetical protein
MANPKLPVPDNLTPDERRNISIWIRGLAYPTSRGPEPFYRELDHSKTLKRHYVTKCLEWHRVKKSRWCVDYERACKNWIENEWKFREERKAQDAIEKPQEPRPARSAGSPLQVTIDMFIKEHEKK